MARNYKKVSDLGHKQSYYDVTYNGKVVNSGSNKHALVQWMRLRGYWNTNTNLPNPGFALNESIGMKVGAIGAKGVKNDGSV